MSDTMTPDDSEYWPDSDDVPTMPPKHSAPVVIVDRASYEALQARLAELEAQLDMEMADELEIAVGRNAELERRNDALFTRAAQRLATVKELEAQLAAAQTEVARLEAELAAIRKQNRVALTPKRIAALADILYMASGDAGWGSQADTVQEILWIANGEMEDDDVDQPNR